MFILLFGFMIRKNIREDEIRDIEIYGKRYLIGDIPKEIYERVATLKTVFSTDAEFLASWRDIIQDIVSIRNSGVNIPSVTPRHIVQMTTLLSQK